MCCGSKYYRLTEIFPSMCCLYASVLQRWSIRNILRTFNPLSNLTTNTLSVEVTTFLIHLFSSFSVCHWWTSLSRRLCAAAQTFLNTILLQDWAAILTKKKSSLIHSLGALFDGNFIAIFSSRRGNKTVCQHERQWGCVCQWRIKYGSVPLWSPCCHLIHSCSRLRTLWHYLRPEELGFLTVDTGQMESGPFIVQQQLFLHYPQHPQKMSWKYSLYLNTVIFIWLWIIQHCSLSQCTGMTLIILAATLTCTLKQIIILFLPPII